MNVVRLACVLLIASAAQLLAQTDPCLTNFTESGSIFKGKTLQTFKDFPSLDRPTVMRRLLAQLPASGLAVLSSDEASGLIRTENQSPNARPFPIDITVSPAEGGVRVALSLKMNPGQSVSADTKPAICGLIALAATEPPPPPKPAEPPLTNEDIVKLVTAGFDDDIIIAKIQRATRTEFDTSTDALLKLKKAKVSKPVMTAMLSSSPASAPKNAASKTPATPRPANPPASPAPATSNERPAVAASQLEADLLTIGMISQGLGELHFRSLEDFLQFSVLATRDAGTVREYDVLMVLRPGAAQVGFSANSKPVAVNATLLYTKRGEAWGLANVTVKQIH